jgi:hypothetical protein
VVSDGPTPGELSRRITELTGRFDELGRFQDQQLVRKDVYQSDQRAMLADQARMEVKTTELEREAEQREAARVKDRSENRRMIWTAVLSCLAMTVGTIIATLVLK